MSHKRAFILSIVACAIVGPFASAHHAMDPKSGTPIELTGTITFVSWDGAHVMYRIEAPNDAGEIVQWEVLGASPKILSSRQIGKSTMKAGERVTVTGYYDRLSKIVAPNFFTTADGHKYEMGFYPPSLPPRK